jgi:hypothetical protein
LNTQAEFLKIIQHSVLRRTELGDRYDRIIAGLLNPYTPIIVDNLFWLIFIMKFRRERLDSLASYRAPMSDAYSKWFFALEPPKDENSNVLIFIFAYATHVLFYKLFPNEREILKFRFILDCYHITTFELNGLLVSDTYVQMNIEKIFNARFFSYESDKRGSNPVASTNANDSTKRTGAGPLTGRPLFDYDAEYNHGLETLAESIVKIPGGLDLAIELSNKIRLKGSGAALSGSASGIITKNKVKGDTTRRHGGASPMNSSTARESAKGLPTHRGKAASEIPAGVTDEPHQNVQGNADPLAEVKKSNGLGGVGLLKMRFNCAQISPTLGRFLENPTCTLPFQQQKVIERYESRAMQQFTKINDQVKGHLESSRRMHGNSEKPVKTVRGGEKKSLLDQYGISKYEQMLVEEKMLKQNIHAELKARYVQPLVHIDHIMDTKTASPTAFYRLQRNQRESERHYQNSKPLFSMDQLVPPQPPPPKSLHVRGKDSIPVSPTPYETRANPSEIFSVENKSSASPEKGKGHAGASVRLEELTPFQREDSEVTQQATRKFQSPESLRSTRNHSLAHLELLPVGAEEPQRSQLTGATAARLNLPRRDSITNFYLPDMPVLTSQLSALGSAGKAYLQSFNFSGSETNLNGSTLHSVRGGLKRKGSIEMPGNNDTQKEETKQGWQNEDVRANISFGKKNSAWLNSIHEIEHSTLESQRKFLENPVKLEYTDNRKAYLKKYKDFVSGSTDSKIDDLMSELLYRKNVISKGITKHSLLSPKKK